ncbi:E3 ubiquitin-protein ligase ptr1 [Nosema granulosis]|uniref:HECT-type E3 ubiquitin transferase n=1 Tax=Nosema granulosis TaxID=83296 RepID=A0A9P6GZ24_9MICR|nr:E3 ubiquitin-protein ligase ptr1 [Nosema granulosis]
MSFNTKNMFSGIFKDFEKEILNEEDDLIFCAYCFFRLKNLNLFVRDRMEDYLSILEKIGEKITRYLDKYMNKGFQCKPFEVEDKIVINCLFKMLEKIFSMSNSLNDLDWVGKLINFVFCFDKDIIFSSFRTIISSFDLSNIVEATISQQEIFIKLSEIDTSINDLIPNLDCTKYKPVENLNIGEDVFKTFREYSKTCSISDLYISIISKLFYNDGSFMIVMKQYSISILLKRLKDEQYYHNVYSTCNLLDLEKIREDIKKVDLCSLKVKARKKFANEVLHNSILKKIDFFYENLCGNDQNRAKERDIVYRNFFYNYMNYVSDDKVELCNSFLDYVLFLLNFDENLDNVILILELNKDSGLFYELLENSIKFQDNLNMSLLTISKVLVEKKESGVLRNGPILNLIIKYLNSDRSSDFEFFLYLCELFADNNESFFDELLRRKFDVIFCEFIQNCDSNQQKERCYTIKTLLNILFKFYKKQNTNLEPFLYSDFLKICLKLRDNRQFLGQVLDILTYFILKDPLSMELLLQCSLIVENITENNVNESCKWIDLFEAFSLNLEFKIDLIKKGIFGKVLGNIINNCNMKEIIDQDFFERLKIFLNHQPDYIDGCKIYSDDFIKASIKLLDDGLVSDIDFLRMENFVKWLRNFDTRYLPKPLEPSLTLIEIYWKVISFGSRATNLCLEIIDVYKMNYLYSIYSPTAFKNTFDKLKNVVNKLKKKKDLCLLRDCSKENDIKILIVTTEKLLCFVSSILDNYIYRYIPFHELVLELNELFPCLIFLLDITSPLDIDCTKLDFKDSKFIDLYKKRCSITKENQYIDLINFEVLYCLHFTINIRDTSKKCVSTVLPERFLDLIINSIEILRSSPQQSKNIYKVLKKSSTYDFTINETYLKVFDILFDSNFPEGFMALCQFIKKIKKNIGRNYRIEEIILRKLAESSKNYGNMVENQYLIIKFLMDFKVTNRSHSNDILKTIEVLISNLPKPKKLTVASLAALVNDNYYDRCESKFPYLMENPNFVVACLTKKNFSILTNSINNKFLEYIIVLLNYHYDHSTMFKLLNRTFNEIIFNPTPPDETRLYSFAKKLRQIKFSTEQYDFEIDLKESKMVNKEGKMIINEDLIFKIFNDVISGSLTTDTPVPWSFILSCAKYYEGCLNKYNLLVDARVLDLCIRRGNENQNSSMLIYHYCFENTQDIYNLQKNIMKKFKSSKYCIENDFKDIYNINRYLIYRFPNIIQLEGKINDLYDNEFTKNEAFLYLLNRALIDRDALFVISEMIYNYPRYISLVDLDCIRNITNRYIKIENFQSEKENDLNIALNFFSVCLQTDNSGFIDILISFLKEIMKQQQLEDWCVVYLILCNISTPIVAKESEMDKDMIESEKKEMRFVKALRKLLSSDLVDNFLSFNLKMYRTNLKIAKEITVIMSPEWIKSIGTTKLFKFLFYNRNEYIREKRLTRDNLAAFENEICTSKDVVAFSLNIVYNFIFNVYKDGNFEPKILDIKLSSDKVENIFTIQRNSDKIYEEKIRCYAINSSDERFKTDFAFSDMVENFFFDDIRPFIIKHLINLEEHNSRKSIGENNIDGVQNGWIPKISIERLKNMEIIDIKQEIWRITKDRLKQNSLGLEIDKNFLESLDENIKQIFISREKEIQLYYKNLPSKEITLANETIDGLLVYFFECNFSCRLQTYNFFQTMSFFERIRIVILKRSIYNLFIKTNEIQSRNTKVYESLIRSIELIRLMVSNRKFPDDFLNIKTYLVRTLFSLLPHKKLCRKVLNLLDVLEIDEKVFKTNLKVDFGEFFDFENDFEKGICSSEEIIALSLLETIRIQLDDKSQRILNNVFEKICIGAFYTFSKTIICYVGNTVGEITLNIDWNIKASYLQNFLNTNFTTFFKFITDKDEVSTLNGKTQISQNQNSSLYDAKKVSDLVYKMECLIKDGFEPFLIKDDTCMLTRFHSLYFSLFSGYEKLINLLTAFKHIDDDILSRFEEHKRNLVEFLKDRSDEINEKISNNNVDFKKNIKFLLEYKVINFVNRKKYFDNIINEKGYFAFGFYKINIERDNLLSDSLNQLMKVPLEDFKTKRLQVLFKNEEGVDDGGLTREWISLIGKHLTNSGLGLFSHSSEKEKTIAPTPNDKPKANSLNYYYMIGKILAKSIIDRTPLDLPLEKTVYKYILGNKPTLSDLEYIEPQYYKSLVWILNNPISNVINLTFSVELKDSDKIICLKKNGRNIEVTDDNKHEYIELMVDFKLFKGVEKELYSMKKGLLEVIDEKLLAIFDENELEILINGTSIIDVDDWKANTEYIGYTNNSQTIVWFWKAVESFTSLEKSKLLQFSTGYARVGFGGFSNMYEKGEKWIFTIQKYDLDESKLPTSHTCANYLNLPEYSSYFELRKYVLYAINECFEGFGSK